MSGNAAQARGFYLPKMHCVGGLLKQGVTAGRDRHSVPDTQQENEK